MSNGKGDKDRTALRAQYETNYDAIFRKPKPKKQPDAPYGRFKAHSRPFDAKRGCR